ncbi:zinc finger, CCHC-type, retrotransposon gag domain protein [Tanacetum coccineum]
MVTTRRNSDDDVPNFEAMINAAVANALPNLTAALRTQITNDIRNGAGNSGGGGGDAAPQGIHVWIERFTKLKPLAFRSAATPAEAEDWITHMEKLFQVLGCPDNFKTRLAAFKLEGDALSWWKAHLRTQVGGDAFADTCTWVAFREIFYNRYFPASEQQRYEREYGSICQLDRENSGEYMERFTRLASFVGATAGDAQRQARHFKWGLKKWVLDRIVNTDYTNVAQVAAAARNIELLHESGNSNKRDRDGNRIQNRGQGQQENKGRYDQGQHEYRGRQDQSVEHRGRQDRGYDSKRQDFRGQDQRFTGRNGNDRQGQGNYNQRQHRSQSTHEYLDKFVIVFHRRHPRLPPKVRVWLQQVASLGHIVSSETASLCVPYKVEAITKDIQCDATRRNVLVGFYLMQHGKVIRLRLPSVTAEAYENFEDGKHTEFSVRKMTRNPKLTSSVFGERITDKLGELVLSSRTAFHPQIDGQSRGPIQTFGRICRACALNGPWLDRDRRVYADNIDVTLEFQFGDVYCQRIFHSGGKLTVLDQGKAHPRIYRPV